MKITSAIAHASVKIFVNDILHIHFVRSKFLGLSTWQYETEGTYYIEIVLDGGKVKTDYDRRDMWLGILAELRKVR